MQMILSCYANTEKQAVTFLDTTSIVPENTRFCQNG